MNNLKKRIHNWTDKNARSRFRALFLLVCLFIFDSSSAKANDTLASIATGRITFEKSAQVSIESEELAISPDWITVKYRFLNQSDKDITSLVSFPIPTITAESPYQIDLMEGENEIKADPFNFELKVNGTSTPIKIERNLNQETRDITLKYYWTQNFPAHKEVLIEHRYRTAPGSAFPDDADKRYCFDDTFKKALQKVGTEAVPRETYLHFYSRRISYILTTGNNWNSPIKNFKLTLDKEKPENLVSLCWSGLSKLSPTKFEAREVNFVPTKELEVYFLLTKEFEEE